MQTSAELQAGPALDRAVAEALGHTICDKAEAIRQSNAMIDALPDEWVSGIKVPRSYFDSWYAHDWYLADTLGRHGMDSVPNYSTDWNDAMLAASKVFTACFQVEFFAAGPSWAANGLTSNDPLPAVAFAETGPLAICRAILKVKHG